MSSYVHGSIPYKDYLQAKSFEKSLYGQISKQTREIIASNEQLGREHISATRSLESTVSKGFDQLAEGFDQLAEGMEQVRQELSQIDATLHWGFSATLTALGRINDSLQDLIQISKTPAQTWAYEQFEIAREAYRKNLYADALEHLDRAINGYGSNSGYKLEYRFHYLSGTIRLGSPDKPQDFVDLAGAEQALVNGAKYAQMDQPREAARAYLGAGWAAYCQGKFPGSIEHTKQSISLFPELAQAHFQMAKVFMHLDQPDQALPSLRRSIEINKNYAIEAGTDGDLQRHSSHVNALLSQLHAEAKEKAAVALSVADDSVKKANSEEILGFRIAEFTDLTPAADKVRELRAAFQTGTYYGYLEAMPHARQAQRNLLYARISFCVAARSEVKRQIDAIQWHSENWFVFWAVTVLGWWISLFIGRRVWAGTSGFTALIVSVGCVFAGLCLSLWGGEKVQEGVRVRFDEPLHVERQRLEKVFLDLETLSMKLSADSSAAKEGG